MVEKDSDQYLHSSNLVLFNDFSMALVSKGLIVLKSLILCEYQIFLKFLLPQMILKSYKTWNI